jgi:hypothetical protein
LGTGNFYFCVYDVTNSGSTYTLTDGSGTVAIFDQATASMVDDDNGSIVLTFANANDDFSQRVALLLLKGATTCPEVPSNEVGFAFATQGGLGLSTSPLVIGVGTLGIVLPFTSATPDFGPVTAGEFLACLYATVDYNEVLVQFLPIAVGAPTPAPAPAPSPVVTPVHAG